MLKYVLCFTFAVSCASAGVIAHAEASCGGMTDTGTTLASCYYSYFYNPCCQGFLSISASSDIVDDILSGAHVSELGDRGAGSAFASLSEDFVFAVTGGTGDGFFVGCFRGFADPSLGGASLSISGTLGGSGGESHAGPLDSCGSQFNFAVERKPFTFGMPQVVTATLRASIDSAGQGPFEMGRADIYWGSTMGDRVLLFDANGNPINASFTLVPVPEPSTLVPIGLLLWLGFRALRRLA